MKKTILIFLMLLITTTAVYSLGMGVINDMDYEIVRKGRTYTREFKFFPINRNCQPYTTEPCTGAILVKITSQDERLSHEPEIIAPFNLYTKVPVILTIPKNAKKGRYNSRICAIGISGTNVNVGACADISYTVLSGKSRWKRHKK